MDSCRAVENEFDKAVKKLSINTVGIEKVIPKLTVFRDELKNSEFVYMNYVSIVIPAYSLDTKTTTDLVLPRMAPYHICLCYIRHIWFII